MKKNIITILPVAAVLCSVVSGQLSAISRQSSVNSNLSVFENADMILQPDNRQPSTINRQPTTDNRPLTSDDRQPTTDSLRTIHVFVALCDNDSQGIIPVSKRVGNGKDPKNNLYWGDENGVRNYFMKCDDWDLLDTIKNPTSDIAERCVWKHRRYNTYLVADAYWGGRIKNCTMNFLLDAAGHSNETISINEHGKTTTLCTGCSQLICYLGHDGFMDFDITNPPQQNGATNKQVIILAPTSRMYFRDAIALSGAKPILWTTNLMTPNAQTLKAALDGWVQNESYDKIISRAVHAYYDKTQCGLDVAQGLFVFGF